MAKRMVRYLLEGNPGVVPNFVENGGYMKLGEELVGLSVDEDVRHVPNTVVRMTRAELLARMELCMKDEEGEWLLDQEGEPLNEAAAEVALDALLEMLGVPDYA